MILKRKLYTNAEGRHTKEVRKKTDKGDVLNSAIKGSIIGGSFGALAGNKRAALAGAAIGSTVLGGSKALVAAGRRKNNKEGKTPHKPDELVYNTEPGAIGKGVMIGGAAISGAALGAKTKMDHALDIAEEILEGKSKRMKKAKPEDIQKFREYLAMNKAAFGPRAGTAKVLNEIANSEVGKKIIKRKRTTGAIIGATTLAGATAYGLAHDHNKKKKLREAFEKDKEEFKNREK
jgi:hypothetical protein